MHNPVIAKRIAALVRALDAESTAIPTFTKAYGGQPDRLQIKIDQANTVLTLVFALDTASQVADDLDALGHITFADAIRAEVARAT